MLGWNIIILVSVVLFFGFDLNGQAIRSGKVESNYTYRHFTTADGLPQIQITALFCDSRGFVWVGTKFGLARWDGKRFKLFTHREGGAGWQVVGINELDNGKIVVWWQSGAFNIIDGDRVETIQLPNEWAASSILTIVPAADSRLYVGVNVFQDDKTYKKSVVATYDIRSRKFAKENWYNEWWIGLITADGLVMNSAANLSQNVSREYNLYLNDRRLDSKVFEKNFSQINYSTGNHISFFADDRIDSMFKVEVKGNRLSLTSEFTGILSDPDIIRPHSFRKLDNRKYLFTDKLQDLYIQTGKKTERIAKLPQMTVSIVDKEGNIWAGTENGLYCFYRLGIKEYQFNIQPGVVDAVWSMNRSTDGTYYYGSYDKGFWLSKDSNQTWTKFAQIDRQEQNELMRKGTYGLKTFSDGSVLLPTSIGFHHWKNNRLTSYSLYGKGAEVYASWEDTTESTVLISKHTYLFKLDLKTLKIDTLLNSYNLSNNPILNIVPNRNNQPIITGGISPHVLVGSKWQPIKGGENVFGTSSVCDYRNSLWVGSVQRLRCLREDTVFEMKNFPARQMVLSMTTWKSKWLIVGGGVDLIFMDLEAYYNRGEELYYTFDAGDGLITTEGGQNSFVEDRDGSVWWCCSDKVIRFWPDKLLPEKAEVLQLPRIFSANAFDGTNRTVSLYDSGSVDVFQLTPGFRRLEFEFGAAAMSNHDKLLYRYRILESDSSWSNPSSNSIAIFDKLSPGTYTFQVQASIDGRNWTGTSSFLRIELNPYWHETIMAKLILTVLLAGILMAFTWWMSNRKKKDIERRKMLNELQLKAIRSKALPHFTGNSFANIDFYVEKGDKENASRYLAILSRLHNITLADSDKPSRSLKEELDYVKLYLTMEKLRFEEKFDYSIKVYEGVDVETQVPNMILHTFAENALKHGLKNKKGPGAILIEILNDKGGIQLSVSDDGIGRKAATETNTGGSRQGLKILNDQLSLYNQLNNKKIKFDIKDLTTAEGKNAGTKFSIFIPENFKY